MTSALISMLRNIEKIENRATKRIQTAIRESFEAFRIVDLISSILVVGNFFLVTFMVLYRDEQKFVSHFFFRLGTH